MLKRIRLNSKKLIEILWLLFVRQLLVKLLDLFAGASTEFCSFCLLLHGFLLLMLRVCCALIPAGAFVHLRTQFLFGQMRLYLFLQLLRLGHRVWLHWLRLLGDFAFALCFFLGLLLHHRLHHRLHHLLLLLLHIVASRNLCGSWQALCLLNPTAFGFLFMGCFLLPLLVLLDKLHFSLVLAGCICCQFAFLLSFLSPVFRLMRSDGAVLLSGSFMGTRGSLDMAMLC